jgi:hypothetical protein
VRIVRLHDPGRRPVSWTDIIEAGEFAAFAKIEASGVPCDVEGVRFADTAHATCALFASLAEARDYCEAAVARHPEIRFDIFDAAGRTRPPLLVVLDPSRAAALETSPRQMRRRRAIAWLLIAAAVPLLLYAWLAPPERDILLPIFFGINAILVGGRLLWMNLALRETERARMDRLTRAGGGSRNR